MNKGLNSAKKKKVLEVKSPRRAITVYLRFQLF
jgi:hypothetical protein